MLDFETEREKVVKDADTKSGIGAQTRPFDSNEAPILMNKCVASASVIEYALAPDVHAAPPPVNESVASSPVIECVTPRPVQFPQLQFIEKTVEIPDFSLVCQGTQTAESSEIAPVLHVSFAETVEVVEFEPHHSAVPVLPDPVVQGVACAAPAKYNAPTLNVAYQVHAAPAPLVEYEAAPSMAYLVHSEPAPVVEYDAPAVTAAYRVHAAPAPVVEYAPAPDVAYRADAAPAPVVEYDAPAVTAAYRVHAAPASVVEYAPAPDVAYTPAPDVAYQAHAAPAPVVECDAPAPTETYWEHAASAPEVTPAPDVAYRAHAAPVLEVEYIASAAAGYAGPAPDEEKYFISMTRLEEVSCAALTFQRGWRWTRKRIVLRAVSEERVEEKLREVRRRFVACFPVGASAKEKTEPQGYAIHPEGC